MQRQVRLLLVDACSALSSQKSLSSPPKPANRGMTRRPRVKNDTNPHPRTTATTSCCLWSDSSKPPHLVSSDSASFCLLLLLLLQPNYRASLVVKSVFSTVCRLHRAAFRRGRRTPSVIPNDWAFPGFSRGKKQKLILNLLLNGPCMAPPSGWEAYIVVRSNRMWDTETCFLLFFFSFLERRIWKRQNPLGDGAIIWLCPPTHTNIYPACCWLTPRPTPMHRSLLGAPLWHEMHVDWSSAGGEHNYAAFEINERIDRPL